MGIKWNLSKSLAGITAIAGFAVLLGWFFDIGLLKSIFPNIVSMKANTAVAFLLLGSSLLFFEYGRKKISGFFAAVVALIGLASLCEYVFGLNLGIDELLFRDNTAAIMTSSPGRMALLTAIDFFVLGIGTLFLLKGYKKISDSVVIFVLLNGFLSFLGYLGNVSEFYRIGGVSISAMALHTSIAFILISLSIGFSNSEKGFFRIFTSGTTAASLLRRSLGWIIGSIVLIGWVIQSVEHTGFYNLHFEIALFEIIVVILISLFLYFNIGFLESNETERIRIQEEINRVRKNYEENLETTKTELESARKALLNILSDLQEKNIKIENDNARSEALLNSIGDAVIFIDKNKKIEVINKAAEDILNLSAKKVVGKIYSDFLTLEDESSNKIPLEKRPLEASIKTGKKIVTNVLNTNLYYSNNNRKFPVAVNVAPVVLNGEIIGAVDVFRDVSHEREVDRSKTEFISVASHQLRTPLTGIKWLTEVMLKNRSKNLTVKQKQTLKEIDESNNRMIALINDLLDVSRIETGKNIALDLKDVAMVDYIKNQVERIAPVAEKRKVKLVLKTDLPKDFTLRIDENKISQAINNLISNAIKYSKPSGGRVTVTAEEDGGEFVFSVADNGIGIPEKDKNRIFQKFFRADNAVLAQTEGTGLGLVIVKSIIESHGGKIWFESEENAGTNFHFSLKKNM